MVNAKLTTTPWRARLIHVVAKIFGVLVHIEGFPFGSARNSLPFGTGADSSSSGVIRN